MPTSGPSSETPEDGTNVSRLYRDRFSEQEVAAKQRIWKVLCADFFAKLVKPTDTVLDIACGYGEFINFIRCRERIAFDLNPDARRHLAPEVRFFNQSCENLGCIPDDSVDVVFESNLFEHLPSKRVLTDVVRGVHRTLRPGGRFILMQPNIKYVAAAYWDFYDHQIPLSHLSCVELLRNCGFAIETVIPRFMPYTTKGRLPVHPMLVRLFLRCRLLWRVLGKQFLIVARKDEPVGSDAGARGAAAGARRGATAPAHEVGR
jgi:SAM-dependent methyltransferase